MGPRARDVCVWGGGGDRRAQPPQQAASRPPPPTSECTPSYPTKVKVAEHILTGHKVAIKILNRRKIQAMDMEEKGEGEAGTCRCHNS